MESSSRIVGSLRIVGLFRNVGLSRMVCSSHTALMMRIVVWYLPKNTLELHLVEVPVPAC